MYSVKFVALFAFLFTKQLMTWHKLVKGKYIFIVVQDTFIRSLIPEIPNSVLLPHIILDFCVAFCYPNSHCWALATYPRRVT